MEDPRVSRQKVVGAVVVVGIVGFAVVTYLLVGNPLDPFDNRTFTPGAWRTADEYGRARMARNLIRRHVRVGMAESQAVALLGEPEIVGTPGDLYGPKTAGTKSLVWSLGQWSTVSLDDASLHVYIDGAVRVAGAEVTGF